MDEFNTNIPDPQSEGDGTTNKTPGGHDPDWAEKSLDEIKAGLKQITGALKYAFNEGRNDPKIKQFGDDVKSAFEKISDDIEDIFKRD